MIVAKIPAVLISLLSFGLTGLPASADVELPKEQIYSLFSQANIAFKAANSATNDSERQKLYEKAVLSYEKIINQGRIKNAKLYYNLANTYFLKEDIGRAILNYRRAEKLDKADSNIRKNLSFARDRRIDKVKAKTERRVLHTLFFWHYDFSLKTKFTLALLSFAFLCVGLTVMVWFGRTAPATVTAVICGILVICFSASVVLEAGGEAGKICGVITAREVVAHQGDWQNSPPSFKEPLHAGTEFDLIEHRRGWLHIRLSDDSDGWIPETTAELI